MGTRKCLTEGGSGDREASLCSGSAPKTPRWHRDLPPEPALQDRGLKAIMSLIAQRRAPRKVLNKPKLLEAPWGPGQHGRPGSGLHSPGIPPNSCHWGLSAGNRPQPYFQRGPCFFLHQTNGFPFEKVMRVQLKVRVGRAGFLPWALTDDGALAGLSDCRLISDESCRQGCPGHPGCREFSFPFGIMQPCKQGPVCWPVSRVL